MPHAAIENSEFLKKIERELSQKNIPAARFEAERLVRHFGLMNRIDFFTGERLLSLKARRAIKGALRARFEGAPLSHILKEADFYGHKFFVSANTLIPRPETELLVDEALRIVNAYYPAKSGAPRILDIGTGTGCVAVSLTLARTDCKMTALDISQEALQVARKNMDFHGLRDKIELVKSDLFSYFKETRGVFREKAGWDILVSNPPYVPEDELRRLPREVRREPTIALDGGPLGLSVIEKILKEAPFYLNEGGWLLMEIGAGQSDILRKRLGGNREYKNLKFIEDLAGIERIMVLGRG